MKKKNNILKKIANKAYEFGFVSKIKTEVIERGLNEEVIRLISRKKNEPEWLLEFRLNAYRHWLTLEMPTWAHLNIPPIDYQAISYYADPLSKSKEKKGGNDINIRADFSFKNLSSICRSIDKGTTQATSGNKAFTYSVTADYTYSKALSFSLYFDRQKTIPLISSSSYPTTTTDFGISMKFSLTR